LGVIRLRATFTSFAAAAARFSRRSGMTVLGCRFMPSGWTVDGVVALSPGQMGYLLEGIDWRNPQQSWRPQAAG
jgi:hypothetical protein